VAQEVERTELEDVSIERCQAVLNNLLLNSEGLARHVGRAACELAREQLLPPHSESCSAAGHRVEQPPERVLNWMETCLDMY